MYLLKVEVVQIDAFWGFINKNSSAALDPA